MKSMFFIFTSLLLPFGLLAQVKAIKIGINGLTCSQCSRTVEFQIRKLAFVGDVKMTLERTEGDITIKLGSVADIKKVAQAIVSAGFSVRYIEADVNFDQANAGDDQCVEMAGNKYVFLKTTDHKLNGVVKVQYIGSQFLPKKDFKKWQPLLKNPCGSSVTPYYVTIKNS